MAPPPQVVQWLKKAYHKPQIDPEWLDACYTWVIQECNLNPLTDFDKIIKHIESQLLQSDLRDSMLHGTGLPANVSELTNTTLGGPILVEIVAMTEIGRSAFTMQNARQARIDRADLTGLAAEEPGEDDSPVPKYPRSMLRFELSDGLTTLQAMEYRPLQELQLGVTPLGYKMLLNDVFIRRGIAFLEPKCVIMKGHQTEDREAMQDADFARGLRMRLGQPEPDPEDEPPAPAAPPPGPPAEAPAAPPLLGEMSPPRSPPPAEPTYINVEDEPRPQISPQPQPTTSDNSTLVQSAYFSGEPYSENSGPSAILARERLMSPTHRSGTAILTTDNENTARKDDLKGKQKAMTSAASSDFGDDGMSMDAEFMEQLDQVEMKAMSNVEVPSAVPRTSTSASRPAMPSAIVECPNEVITIEDEEDDKENVPASTRRVRRRIEPVFPPGEVIELSDSD